jgi:hypothetical protein
LKNFLRVMLRIVGVVALAAAVYLIVLQPKATVAGAQLVKSVNVSVQCSSLWDQWTHHAKPASLNLDGQPLLPLQAAQGACTSASTKIRHAVEGLAIGGVVAFGASVVLTRGRH